MTYNRKKAILEDIFASRDEINSTQIAARHGVTRQYVNRLIRMEGIRKRTYTKIEVKCLHCGKYTQIG